MSYPFRIVNHQSPPLTEPSILQNRPFSKGYNSFTSDARLFVPGEELETAINTALAVGAPLLMTGEPGTGKTQAAYYTAYKLGLEPVLHFQVKSESSAGDLLYYFDAVRYFHDANTRSNDSNKALDKKQYVERRPLWQAFVSEKPSVLLIDEIDKAPRDFPNDLLHELDKMEFIVAETQEQIRATPDMRPIVFITSNSERRLPEPFLRRCIYHNIRFNEPLLRQAIEQRRQEYAQLSEGFLEMALRQFLALRARPLRKTPSTGELLVWLRVLATAIGTYPEKIDSLAQLPFLGTLLKDQQDIQELGIE
ncbi:MAG TPA: MoxR family ATPase [Pyrinomonadaceae bacterium]|nr:MoxR family ATPase [Pyrinomonadaceae bacterium]